MSVIYTSGGASVADATTTVSGKVRLATIAEANGTSETIAVTPAGLQAELSAVVSGGVTYRGVIAGDDIPTLDNALQGDMYRISVASSGVVAGYEWSVGDTLLVNADMGGTFDSAKINYLDSTDDDLATVATSGSYNDLLNQPTIPSASTDLSDSADLVRDVDLATVATSGSYNDLLNQPTIPTASTDLSDSADLVRDVDLATVATSGSYNDLLNQPTIPSASTDLSDSADLARLASPALTGTPTAPTATAGTNTTQLATTEFVTTAVAGSSADYVVSNQGSTNFSASNNTFYYVATASGTRTEVTMPSRTFSATDERIKFFNHGDGVLRVQETSGTSRIHPNEAGDDPGGSGFSYKDIDSRCIIEFIGIPNTYNWEWAISSQLELGKETLANDGDVLRFDTASNQMKALPYAFPISDGTQDQILKTDGAGALSFIDQPTIPTASTDLSDSADLVRDVDLATVATSGSYNDLLNQPTIPTASTDLSDSADLARLASPALTGTPTAPTAIAGTNTTQLATTAFVTTAVAGVASGTQYKGAVAYDAISTTLVNAVTGDMYRLSSTGSALGYDWTIGDLIIVNADMGGTFDSAKINRFDTTDADLATVATTGAYSDLTGTPTLATVATSGAYSDLTGTPTLATVATSGSYNDLLNQPTIPTASTDLSDSADLARLASPALTGTPTAPTASAGTNTTQLATTEFVTTALSSAGDYTYSAITADPANAQAGYHYSCTGTFTLTLPTSGVSAGSEIRIKNMGTGTITIDPQTSTIDDGSSYTLDIRYSAITLVSDGTDWEII